VLALVATVLTQMPLARAADQVDLLLVLAMDVSRSMDQEKFQLQRQGYAAAISNPRAPCNRLRSAPEDCDLLHRLVWPLRAETGDRLEHH
jgi:hypothetical protein